MTTLQKICQLEDELEILRKKQKKLDEGKKKRWFRKFVQENRTGISIHLEPTDLGMKELHKYGIEYLKESPKEFSGYMWENPGISYTPLKCFCMICQDLHTTDWIQLGLFPRFATCSKHNDFLMLFAHLKKWEHESR